MSYDSPLSRNMNNDAIDDIQNPDFLNTINTLNLPNHKLGLKVSVATLLLKNIDQRSGLCNDTRLNITRMGKFVLEGKVISGSNIGEKVFIPKLSLTPSDVKIPFKFQRR